VNPRRAGFRAWWARARRGARARLRRSSRCGPRGAPARRPRAGAAAATSGSLLLGGPRRRERGTERRRRRRVHAADAVDGPRASHWATAASYHRTCLPLRARRTPPARAHSHVERDDGRRASPAPPAAAAAASCACGGGEVRLTAGRIVHGLLAPTSPSSWPARRLPRAPTYDRFSEI